MGFAARLQVFRSSPAGAPQLHQHRHMHPGAASQAISHAQRSQAYAHFWLLRNSMMSRLAASSSFWRTTQSEQDWWERGAGLRHGDHKAGKLWVAGLQQHCVLWPQGITTMRIRATRHSGVSPHAVQWLGKPPPGPHTRMQVCGARTGLQVARETQRQLVEDGAAAGPRQPSHLQRDDAGRKLQSRLKGWHGHCRVQQRPG